MHRISLNVFSKIRIIVFVHLWKIRAQTKRNNCMKTHFSSFLIKRLYFNSFISGTRKWIHEGRRRDLLYRGGSLSGSWFVS